MAATTDQVTEWATVGTAAGTLLLAIATFVLAMKTREEVAVSIRQAKAAEESLRAQTTPLLTSPPLRPKQSGMTWTAPDPAEIRGGQGGDAEGPVCWISVPLTNVGNGAAIVRAVRFVCKPGGAELVGNSTRAVIAPGQLGSAQVAATDDVVSGEFDSLLDVVLGEPGHVQVVVEYADAAGQVAGAVRLDLRCSRHGEQWSVLGEHWGTDLDGAINSPYTSSHDPYLSALGGQ